MKARIPWFLPVDTKLDRFQVYARESPFPMKEALVETGDPLVVRLK